MEGFNLRTPRQRGCRFPSGHLSTRSTNQFYTPVSVDNLKRIFEQATEHDLSIGLDAFPKYNRIMVKLADHCGTTPRIASAVFSALSPNNDYHGNLRDANTLLRAARAGKTLEDFAVSTYGQNKRKAWRIAHGEDPLDLIVAKKTRSFFQNIYDPSDPVPVTVDGHMVNVWRCKRENLVGLSFPKSLYDVVADGVRTVAQEQGLVPCQVQSIIWMTWRRLHGIKSPAQMELWDADIIAARLGFHPVAISDPLLIPAESSA